MNLTAIFDQTESLNSENVSFSSRRDWLHENTTVMEATALLDSVGRQDGLFMITDDVGSDSYSLLFFLDNKLNNYEITRVNFVYFEDPAFGVACSSHYGV